LKERWPGSSGSVPAGSVFQGSAASAFQVITHDEKDKTTAQFSKLKISHEYGFATAPPFPFADSTYSKASLRSLDSLDSPFFNLLPCSS
jgi:hypothetical protein